jgi:hypothetical protein
MANIERGRDGAPKVKPPSKKFQQQMAKVLADKEKMAELKLLCKTSVGSDHHSPTVSPSESSESAGISTLPCLQCQKDDSIDQPHKDARYTLDQLDRHLDTDYHTRIQQLMREFDIDPGAGNKASCPLCEGLEPMTKAACLAHLEREHPDQLL